MLYDVFTPKSETGRPNTENEMHSCGTVRYRALLSNGRRFASAVHNPRARHTPFVYDCVYIQAQYLVCIAVFTSAHTFLY